MFEEKEEDGGHAADLTGPENEHPFDEADYFEFYPLHVVYKKINLPRRPSASPRGEQAGKKRRNILPEKP